MFLDSRHFSILNLRHGIVTSCLLAALLAAGCDQLGVKQQDVPDHEILARAAHWPEYKAPKVIDLAIIAGDRPTIDYTQDDDEERPAWMVISYEDWDLQATAEDSLGRIGGAAGPALVKALRDEDPKSRLRAAKILGRIGPDAKDAVNELVRVLEDPRIVVRKAAARALGQIGPAAGRAVGPLLQVIDEPLPPRERVIQTTSAVE
ncbi:MAG TPA: HEAT repeat domain-containing protein [Pirellulaceae bacterium]